jgi:hypothetical protein
MQGPADWATGWAGRRRVAGGEADVWGWVMGFLGGAAGSGHRLQCHTSLVNRLAEACEPPCRTRRLITKAAIAPWRKVRGRGDGVVFRFCYRFLCLPGIRPCPAASGRPSGFWARGSTVIPLHVSHSKFSPDGEGTSSPSPQRGQRSPGLVVGDSACWLMPGMSPHSISSGANRPIAVLGSCRAP